MSRRAEGFTLIEVIVAMLISLLAAGAVLAMITTGQHSSLAGQRQTDLLSVAQQQIEQIRQTFHQYGFDAVSVNGASSSYLPAPDASIPANPRNPDDFIQGYGTAGASFQVKANYHDATSATLATEPLLFDTSKGQIVPYSAGVSAGGADTATVWRFISQRTESCNSTLPVSGSCLNDSRRIVVAVRIDNPSGNASTAPSTPIYLSAVIDRPQPSNTPTAGNGLRIGVHIQ